MDDVAQPAPLARQRQVGPGGKFGRVVELLHHARTFFPSITGA